MERYKITNFDGSIILERGDDLERLLAGQRQSDFVGKFLGDAPTWRVVWELTEGITDPFNGCVYPSEYVPIDKFFYGSEEPEQDVPCHIEAKINAYYDYLAGGWEGK